MKYVSKRLNGDSAAMIHINKKLGLSVQSVERIAASLSHSIIDLIILIHTHPIISSEHYPDSAVEQAKSAATSSQPYPPSKNP